MVSIPTCGEKAGNELKLQPLILPSTGHAGDLGDDQLQSRVTGGHSALTCLGILSSKGCHTSTCLGIRQSRGPRRSSFLNLPRVPILGRLTCLDLPGDSISMRLSSLSLPGDLHPDSGMPNSQVTTVLGRIRRRQWHPTPVLLPGKSHVWRSLMGSRGIGAEKLAITRVVHGVATSQTRLSNFTFTFHFHALEEEMATHSSIFAWRIPGMGEPGGLLST